MAANYYSVQTFLAWCLNHYFYGEVHFAYVGAPFHPYKRPNPSSSNPWQLYGAHYEPWWSRDEFDAHIRSARMGIEGGVIHHQNAGTITLGVANCLKLIAQRVDVAFFYPVVYRVDIDAIDQSRRRKSGSGLTTTSDEWLIHDLQESEFDCLFFDADSDDKMDPDVSRLGAHLTGGGAVGAVEAFNTLWARRIP